MSDAVLRVSHVSKQFSLSETHDSLRDLISAGDNCGGDIVDRHRSGRYARARIVVCYGNTDWMDV